MLNNCLNNLAHPEPHLIYQADLRNTEFVKTQSELLGSRFKRRNLVENDTIFVRKCKKKNPFVFSGMKISV
jgi:hypothetical protein